MSKEPTPGALDYTPVEPEVYRAGYVTAMDNCTDLDDARYLYELLHEDHGRKARAPKQPEPELTVVEPCPEEAASLNGHRKHKLAGESCETCKAAAREYHRTYGQRHRAQRNEASRRYRARLRYER